MTTRRVAKVLVIFALVMAVAWVLAFIATGYDNAGLRIIAVLPAAVGITLFRLVPKDASAVAGPGSEQVPDVQGALMPAPIDIVDR